MLVIVQNDPGVPTGICGGSLTEAGVPFRTIRLGAGEALPLGRGFRKWGT